MIGTSIRCGFCAVFLMLVLYALPALAQDETAPGQGGAVQARAEAARTEAAREQTEGPRAGDRAVSASPLGGVVVTASRVQESKREVPVNVTVLTAQTIRNSTANTMAQLLSQQGFVVLNQGTSKILKMRGMGQRSMQTEMTSEVLVLLNGRRIGANNVGLMGLDNIERIEIIRGPSAVQYGPSAMGGVVNVITRRGTEDVKAGVEIGGGSFGLFKQAANFSGAKNGLDFSAGLTHMSRDDYRISNNHKWKNTSYDSLLNTNIDLGYTFVERHRFGLNFNYYGQDEARSPGSGWSGTGAIGNNADYNDIDLYNRNLAFSYEGATEDKRFNWMGRYSFGQDRSDANYISATWGDSDADNKLDNEIFTGQVGYEGDMVSLSVGFDRITYDYDQKGTWTNNKSDYRDTGVYASGKLRLLDDRLIFSAGGRFDWYKITSESMTRNMTDEHFSPSVGVAVLPLDWLKLRVNYSEGFKMPSPDQLGGDGYYYEPNYGLSPEKSKTYEAGVDVAWRFVDANLTYFHSEWDDKIVALSTGPGTYRYQNLDGATIAGLEAGLSADIGEAFEQEFELRPYVNLTYLTTRKNKDDSTAALIGNRKLPDTPETTISYGLTFSHPGIGLTTTLNASYFSKTITQDWRTNSATYGGYITHDGGTVVDWSLEQRIVDFNEYGTLKIRAEINNLFDDDNDRYLDYPEPGRNYYVGLRYDF